MFRLPAAVKESWGPDDLSDTLQHPCNLQRSQPARYLVAINPAILISNIILFYNRRQIKENILPFSWAAVGAAKSGVIPVAEKVLCFRHAAPVAILPRPTPGGGNGAGFVVTIDGQIFAGACRIGYFLEEKVLPYTLS